MEFSSSLHFDHRLWRQDIAATRAHARGLCRAGILTKAELSSISQALDQASAEFAANQFEFDDSDEDIHSAIERYLIAKLGDAGAKIHAGRSRNDLVATDLRLWLKDTIPQVSAGILDLQEALAGQAERHLDTLAPGYTHLQRAQPIVLAHLFLAHAFGLGRDIERMQLAYRSADVSVLGAAAFAGTTLPLDAAATAADLGFSRVFENSADAVSNRDFAVEFLAACAILGVHLSRLGEEIVLYTSAEFGYARLDDAHSTGSSIMPQKKNPDVAELVRAKSARVTSNLVHLLVVLKGLPMAYNRDLQEDKEPVFDAADSMIRALVALSGAVTGMTFDESRLQAAVESGAIGATDLAEALVMKGVPFREAHEAVGKLAAAAATQGADLADLDAGELTRAHRLLDKSMLDLLDPRTSVGSRNSHGGTAPERVKEQLSSLQTSMAATGAWLRDFRG